MEIVERGELLSLEKICQKTKKSLETRLSQLSPETSHSIYKVPKHLRDVNKKAFEPRIVAIGPYHHGRDELKRMEEVKLRYLQQFLNRKPDVPIKDYISAIAKELKRARDCYEEASINLNDNKFTHMLVLDGCFIIQVIKYPELFLSTFPDRSSYRILQRDLILLENQIPFFVLCKLFDLVEGPEQHRLLMEDVLIFCEDVFPGNTYEATTMRSSEEVDHILDLIHSYWCPPYNSSDHHAISVPVEGCCASWCCPTTKSSLSDIIPSASELKDANVKFRNKEYDRTRNTSLFDVEFSDSGKMLMPSLVIGDWTESSLRNLIAYEQLFPPYRRTCVVDYIVLLDCLVNTSKDVQILCRAKIIKNLLGSEEAVMTLVNKLGEGVMLDSNMYEDTFTRINAHHRKCWNRAVAAFHRDYFNTPWAYIAFLGALLLFLLTAAQTAFSALQMF